MKATSSQEVADEMVDGTAVTHRCVGERRRVEAADGGRKVRFWSPTRSESDGRGVETDGGRFMAR